MIRIFENLEEFNTFTNNGQDLVSGDLYWVEDSKSAFFLTNNIDGNVKKYDMLTGGIPEEYIIPSGNIEITENGENIDVAQYATASVNVASTGGTGTEDLRDLIEGDITTLNIPEGTTSIREYIFNYCPNLTSVTIPNTVTSIGDYGFNVCFSLKDITIPESVETIGQRAFNGCRSLENMNIPNSVTSIDTYAFFNCSGLKNVTLGNAVIFIYDFAFYNCTNLKSITITTTTPPQILLPVFDDAISKIYVPAESVNAYKTATNWSSYASRIYAIGSAGGVEIGGGGVIEGDPSGGPIIN